MKDKQGNAFNEADPIPGGQGGRLKCSISDGGGTPPSPYFCDNVVSVGYFALLGLPDLWNQTLTHRDRSTISVRMWIL